MEPAVKKQTNKQKGKFMRMLVSPFIPLSNTLIRPDKGCQLPAAQPYTAGSWLSALVLVLQCALRDVVISVAVKNPPF